jgi:hypothetical protein
MSGDPGAIRRFFTLFSVLGAVVVIGGIYALTSHRTNDRIGGVVIGACLIAFSEWLGWRLSRR